MEILEMPRGRGENGGEGGGEEDVFVVDCDRTIEEVERACVEVVRSEVGREEGDFLRLN